MNAEYGGLSGAQMLLFRARLYRELYSQHSIRNGSTIRFRWKTIFHIQIVCIHRDYSVFLLFRFFLTLAIFFLLVFSPFYFQPSMIRTTSRPIFVVVSCGCCFLQSCIAFGILLPILYSRKCSVTFLKMQFCTATSTAMAIFTLGFSKLLPEVSWKYVCV